MLASIVLVFGLRPTVPANAGEVTGRVGFRWEGDGGLARLRVSLENLLDTNYREHGSGINGPGRNFEVSVEMGG